jgi:hypothetical protein
VSSHEREVLDRFTLSPVEDTLVHERTGKQVIDAGFIIPVAVCLPSYPADSEAECRLTGRE